MKWTKARIAAFAALVVLTSPLVFAVGEKTFTWQPPTERVDGEALPQAEIASYNIYCDGVETPIWTQPNEPLGTDTWIAPSETFARGTHSCFATTVDTEGQESDPSNIVNFTVSPARPLPPSLAVQ